MGGELEHDWRAMFVFNTVEMFFEEYVTFQIASRIHS